MRNRIKLNVCRFLTHPCTNKFLAVMVIVGSLYFLIVTRLVNETDEEKVQLNRTLPNQVGSNAFNDFIYGSQDLDPRQFNTGYPFVRELRLFVRSGEHRFTNEESRVLGIPETSFNQGTPLNRSPIVIYLATEFFSEVNPRHYYFPHLGSQTFQRYPCPVSDCEVTKSKERFLEANAALFHVRDILISGIPQTRKSDQIFILYSMEPPWLELLNFDRFDGYFNWTMSYRQDSDVLIKYGFVGIRESSGPIRSILKKTFQEKEDKAVWYVSNCCSNSGREDYVRELLQYYPVDVLGGCGQESCRPAEAKKCYRKIAKIYKFYLAFENAICQSYVTEKLFNVLEHDLVPVVFGGVHYSTVAPPHSYINALDYKEPKDLADYLWMVSNNFTLYNSYFDWKTTYRSYLHPWMCDLCAKLHEARSLNYTKVRTNLSAWWNEGGTCRRWENGKLIPSRSYDMPCYNKMLYPHT